MAFREKRAVLGSFLLGLLVGGFSVFAYYQFTGSTNVGPTYGAPEQGQRVTVYGGQVWVTWIAKDADGSPVISVRHEHPGKLPIPRAMKCKFDSWQEPNVGKVRVGNPVRISGIPSKLPGIDYEHCRVEDLYGLAK